MSLSWGSVKLPIESPLPLDTQLQAPVQELPSAVMYCEVAPAARMPSMPAWFRLTTTSWSMSWNSLLMSKMTLVLLANSVATLVHHVLKPSLSLMMLPLKPGMGQYWLQNSREGRHTAIVVGDDHGIGTQVGDVVDRLLEVGKVGGVKGVSHGAVSKTLHQDVDTEGVHPLVNEGINGRQSRPDIVGVQSSGQVTLAKLRARLVDAKEGEGRSTLLLLVLHRRSQCKGSRTGDEKSRNTHGERLRETKELAMAKKRV